MVTLLAFWWACGVTAVAAPCDDPWEDRPLAEAAARLSELRSYAWSELENVCGVVPIGPGAFAAAGGSNDHERATTCAIGQLMNFRWGISLVLVSNQCGIDVPAFDGLVVDQHRFPIANFSLKRFSVSNKSSRGHLSRSLRGAEVRSRPDGWISELIAHAMRTREALRQDDSPAARVKMLEYWHRDERRAERFIRLFTERPPRPIWMILEDLSVRGLAPEILGGHQQRTLQRPHLTTFVKQGPQVIVIRAGRSQALETIEMAGEMLGAWSRVDRCNADLGGEIEDD